MKPYYALAYDYPHATVDKGIFGGKGAGLIKMIHANLPVPQALILTTEEWRDFRDTGMLRKHTVKAIVEFLDAHPASMFSVRSGAPVSMPGMMDTVLNVGVTASLDAKYPGAFRRFATAWLSIVKGIEGERIKHLMGLIEHRVKFTDMTADPANDATRKNDLLAKVIQKAEGLTIPLTRIEQVLECVQAVFKSWDTPRAKAYRKMHDIPEDMGTACVIQRMVMGTASGLSGSGVMFTRNPATGADEMKGEIAFQAQGEEVVSGEVTPLSLDALAHSGNPEWENLHSDLLALCAKLEHYFDEVQDIEFTVETGKLFVLQTRTAKMSALARIETACARGMARPEPQRLTYIKARVNRALVKQTMVPHVDTDMAPAHNGLAASPGAISGKIVFRATPLTHVDKTCILVAEDTAPDDFPHMAKAGGILTKTGGFTCHSAVVARGIGVPAVVGCDALEFTDKAAVMIAGVKCTAGTPITIDGTTGNVYLGKHDVKKAQPPRSIYSALNQIVHDQYGQSLPDELWYYDCGLGQRVALPIDPADHIRMETQLSRAHRLKAKGKDVGLIIETQGTGEDMFDLGPLATFEAMANLYAADFKGLTILSGVPANLAPKVAAMLGATVNTNDNITALDLLDLLGE